MKVIQSIRNQFNLNKSAAVAESTQRFFKHQIVCYGLKNADVMKIAKDHFALVKDLSKEAVFAYCETFWQSGILEEGLLASSWAYRMKEQFVPSDLATFERWIDTYINNWASCDNFCNQTVGAFLMKYPELLSELFRWAKSDNLWMRRAAAVSLIVPTRKGLFKEEVFRLADILLLDKEDMVQKGYGWMLKVTIKHHLQEVFGYVMENKAAMPRTSLRYAIENMPDEMKKAAMLKDF